MGSRQLSIDQDKLIKESFQNVPSLWNLPNNGEINYEMSTLHMEHGLTIVNKSELELFENDSDEAAPDSRTSKCQPPMSAQMMKAKDQKLKASIRQAKYLLNSNASNK